MNELARNRTVADIIEEYEAKSAAIDDECAHFVSAIRRLEMAGSIGGKYGGQIFVRGVPTVWEGDMRKVLLTSAWKAIYDRCQIDRLASAKDKAKWERTLANPPPLTFDTAKSTFGDYILRPRWHIMRGLAEVFTSLDPSYKSHSKVKIGVKALPKRVIINAVGSFGSYGRDKLRDLLNALAAYQGIPPVEHEEFAALDRLNGVFNHTAGEVAFDGTPLTRRVSGKDEEWIPPKRGVRVKKFQNGNAHVIFDPAALTDINRALAEFYGEVLPDAEGEEPQPRATSTAVAKDLQFYPTPATVIRDLLYEIGLQKLEAWNVDRFEELYVLEPSCGDGRIMDEIRAHGHRVLGYEVDPRRAAAARAAGNAVVTANFLEQPPSPEFDLVVMNPPFYGRHWLYHVRHAMKFLKPGCRLAAILPASAHYDQEVTKEFGGRWVDLPVGSFAESGTNVPTGILLTSSPRMD